MKNAAQRKSLIRNKLSVKTRKTPQTEPKKNVKWWVKTEEPHINGPKAK
jgi:hypothetical protein